MRLIAALTLCLATLTTACGADGHPLTRAYVACRVECGQSVTYDGRSYEECLNPPENDESGVSCAFQPQFASLPQ